MKKVLISAGLALCSIAHAATPVDGWYSSLFGGYTYFPHNVTTTVAGFVVDGPSYNGGYHAGASIGYKVLPIRYEAEFTYLKGNANKFYVNDNLQLNVRGNTTATLGMANIYYDFPDMVPAIAPYLGVGIGYGWVQARFSSNNLTSSFYFNEDASVFAYQAMTGLMYNFAENYSVSVGYRYVGTSRPAGLGQTYQAHLATAGVTYRFDEGTYK